MKKTTAIFFTLGMMLIMVFPVYALETGTINWESKAAYALWEFIDSNVTYHVAVSYVISNLHTETEPVNKEAIAYVVITRVETGGEKLVTFVESNLTKNEYTLPTFSKGNKPALETIIQGEDSERGESYELSIDVVWECLGDKTKRSFHPPQDDPRTRILSYEMTFCPAVASGSIMRDGINLIEASNQSKEGFITHHRRVMINYEPY